MARKACLHLEEWERRYLAKYGILPHTHYRRMIEVEGVPYKEAYERQQPLIQTILKEMDYDRKHRKEKEYQDLMEECPFIE